MLYLTSHSLLSSRARSSRVARRIIYFEVAATQHWGRTQTAVAAIRAFESFHIF